MITRYGRLAALGLLGMIGCTDSGDLKCSVAWQLVSPSGGTTTALTTALTTPRAQFDDVDVGTTLRFKAVTSSFFYVTSGCGASYSNCNSNTSYRAPLIRPSQLADQVIAIGGQGPDNYWTYEWTLNGQIGDHVLVLDPVCDNGVAAGRTVIGTYATGDQLGVYARAGAPVRLEPVGAQPVAVPNGAVKPDPAVRALDRFGNPAQGTRVDFLVAPSNGVVSAATVVTDAAGIASVSWNLSGAKGNGPFTLVATAPTIAQLPNSVQFSVASVAPAPAYLTIVSGDQQVALSGTSVRLTPTVQVLDPFGAPVAGVVLTFSITAGGGLVIIETGSASSATRTTDANGRASVVGWQLGAPGLNQLAVNTTFQGVAPPSVLFTATATTSGQVIISDAFDRSSVGSWDMSAIIIPAGTTSIGHAVSNLPNGGDPAGNANPNGYRRMTHQFTAATPTFVTIDVRHVYRGASYDPQAGPINRIEYREARIRLVPAVGDIGSAAIIEQNGIIHVAPLTGGVFSNGTWASVVVTLRASDFTPQPDFSVNGAPMWFGFSRANSQRFPITLEHGIDNWSVTIFR